VRPFAFIGLACVIAGGLASAAIAPDPTEHGAGAVAYLVLICGVAQAALGAGQNALAVQPPSQRLRYAELVGWNLGNAAVIAGTLSNADAVVFVGGAILLVVLALFVYGVRGSATAGSRARAAWIVNGFRTLVVVLLISIPSGLVLAALRNG
jgi:hypothetical protein